MGESRKSTAPITLDDAVTAALLFSNFFLILFTYSIARSVRGSLVLAEMGAIGLPWLWAMTALSMGIFVMVYGRILDFLPRALVFSCTSLMFIILLAVIKLLLPYRYPWLSGAFYVWGDLFSVIMTEQFWSLCNDLYDVKRAKRFFGIVGSGGIIGGIAGALLTISYVKVVGTEGLLSVCFFVLIFQLLLTIGNELFLRRERRTKVDQPITSGKSFLDGVATLLESRYLIGILVFVVLTQVVSNVVDYQFNLHVKDAGFTVDEQTAYFGKVFFWVNTISLVGVILWAPVFQRFMGVFGTLVALPIADFIGTVLLWITPGLGAAFNLRIADKSVQYSLHKASKELLYVPTTRKVKYKVKSVIDMFAYRFSAVLSSLLIIPLVKWVGAGALSYISLACCAVLFWLSLFLSREFSRKS